jgi:AcrR family transcriptional regulator
MLTVLGGLAEFERELTVSRWLSRYAVTSTDDLLRAMNIGRQSMYDTFGDKHRLYLEALEKYQRESVAENIRRLRSTVSPLAGIEAFALRDETSKDFCNKICQDRTHGPQQRCYSMTPICTGAEERRLGTATVSLFAATAKP